MSETPKVWPITGSARGLLRRLADLAERHGDRLRVVPLDVTDADAAARAVQVAAAPAWSSAGLAIRPAVADGDVVGAAGGMS